MGASYRSTHGACLLVTKIVLLCASLLVSLGMVELSLRLLYPPPLRFLYPQESYEFDPEIGHTLRPGQTAFTHARSVRTNALGLRDHELAPEPPPRTLRVLALGDSQTFGNGLDLADTWPKQLESLLQQRGPFRWEVINGGIPGTDTWQHEILLARLVEATNPHVVVLALYVNDVVPRFLPRSLGASEPTNTWSKRITYLLKRSLLVTWTYHRLFLPWRAQRLQPAGSVEDAVLAGREDERAERGWRQVDSSLAIIKQLTDAHKATLLVAILPRRDQVSGDHPGRAYNERARKVAAAHGITALDLLPDLSKEYRVRGDALFIHWDGHNAATANHVIAAQLAPMLEALGPRLGTRRSAPRTDLRRRRRVVTISRASATAFPRQRSRGPKVPNHRHHDTARTAQRSGRGDHRRDRKVSIDRSPIRRFAASAVAAGCASPADEATA